MGCATNKNKGLEIKGSDGHGTRDSITVSFSALLSNAYSCTRGRNTQFTYETTPGPPVFRLELRKKEKAIIPLVKLF